MVSIKLPFQNVLMPDTRNVRYIIYIQYMSSIFFFSLFALHSAWSNTHNTAYLKIFQIKTNTRYAFTTNM
uniref:Uncharacterized protein n=1 Tax=Anguilla anguilla TaxID=7936 RepID=A0A0E9Q8G1_ANGAN